LQVAAVIFLADFSDADAALDQYFSRSPPAAAGASRLAPTEGAFIEMQAKKRPEPVGASEVQRCG
ncbi:hypothetical protein C4E44_31030, partial [Pseudomonas sp. MWU12-2312b]